MRCMPATKLKEVKKIEFFVLCLVPHHTFVLLLSQQRVIKVFYLFVCSYSLPTCFSCLSMSRRAPYHLIVWRGDFYDNHREKCNLVLKTHYSI